MDTNHLWKKVFFILAICIATMLSACKHSINGGETVVGKNETPRYEVNHVQTISKILVNARKKKGIDLEQAAHDTNISKIFLIGLESDNYDNFPGEQYVLGFLRNYATYLGLNPDEIVKIYKQTNL